MNSKKELIFFFNLKVVSFMSVLPQCLKVDKIYSLRNRILRNSSPVQINSSPSSKANFCISLNVDSHLVSTLVAGRES